MPEGAVSVVAGVEGLETNHGPLFAVIGVFDGIHLGHQYLLRHLVSEARGRGAHAAVITFDSHPDEILVGAAPPLLVDPSERLRLLGEAGVEVVIVQHFDAALRATEYDDFLHRITARTSLGGLLMTPDAAFGHDRRGTAETVAALGERDGFDVVVVPPFAIDDRPVSSSEIRRRVTAGDLGGAADLMGRPYSIVATIGEEGFLDVAMPVALPPAGSYRSVVECVDVSEPRTATLNVASDGALRLEPPGRESSGTRLHVEFGDG
jgi:riboflavin kinase / FMN adenylyltransferase